MEKLINFNQRTGAAGSALPIGATRPTKKRPFMLNINQPDRAPTPAVAPSGAPAHGQKTKKYTPETIFGGAAPWAPSRQHKSVH
jgi:hypothetical protein